MTKSLSIIILAILLSIANVNAKSTKDYDLLLEWGLNHSVFISDKIGINYTSENLKNFYVKEDIDKNETIMIRMRKRGGVRSEFSEQRKRI